MITQSKFEIQTALLAKLDQPTLLIDREQVTYANDAATRLLGTHIIGANVRLAIRAPSAISAVLAPQDSRALVTGIGNDGSLWELNCQQLEGSQKLVTMQDMSAQRSIARVHADFVANASHELRTPLANILGYVETLGDEKAIGDVAVRTRFLGIIQREAVRMQSLVSDLMSLSRIEADRHRMPEEKVNLVSVCNKIAAEFSEVDQLAVSLPAKKVKIRGDDAQLCQMLRNLIDNAIKYGKLEEKVRLSLSVTPRGWALITVVDDGVGIPPEHLPRLTERFYRTDPGRSKAAGGTGLGLSIVKHIVSRHRGKLDISSEIGSGTTIEIRLPLLED